MTSGSRDRDGKLSNGSQDFDGLPLEDVYARLEAEHGKQAAKVVARFMGLPPKPYRKPPPKRVGVKAKVPPSPFPRPAPTGNPGWRELNALRKLEEADHGGVLPERVMKLYVSRQARSYGCAADGCVRLIMRGDEVALLVPSGRRVHGECVASILAKGSRAGGAGL